MTKYLSTMSLILEYKQMYLEKFDFRVKNCKELCDGVRLAKLVDTVLNVRLVDKLAVIERREASTAVGSGERRRQAFIHMRLAAIVIQRRWRATTAIRVNRERMLKLKQVTAVSVISETRLALIKMRLQGAEFIKLKRSVNFLQQKWRATLPMRKHRSRYSALKTAMSVISERKVGTHFPGRQ
ncbi:hypothetical protein LSTR_LSTR008615 [Laodelphax striatellus]|uniref:Calponin-homology (CH) domain-containing protein n=1 Tax=Laodelphax striatellus TaxID=195883 RepID=A0A482WZQ5_LAOST|nr:hypothetical protein LSTR_LSTR008615 [Laodelphax striatellus]